MKIKEDLWDDDDDVQGPDRKSQWSLRRPQLLVRLPIILAGTYEIAVSPIGAPIPPEGLTADMVMYLFTRPLATPQLISERFRFE